MVTKVYAHLFQMWRHDCGGQRPIDSRNEPFGAGAHAEGAAQPSGANSGLLAWQPCITGTEIIQPAVRSTNSTPKGSILGMTLAKVVYDSVHPYIPGLVQDQKHC